MAQVIEGKVFVLGDNIDTDQIIPAEYLNLVPTIPEEYRKLGSRALSGLPTGYPAFVRDGEEKSDYAILIAGKNFGCGSSREHATLCLGAAGVHVVAAESYARIFFRNAVATGELYPYESVERLVEKFHTGDEAAIHFAHNTLTNKATGKVFVLKPLGEVKPVIDAGGLFNYARKTGMIPS